ncbi:MAG: helix-turn-helix transcriptional regulator [Candidatus Hydrogenedentes bacterium]|nr:helix-turn-helix transcriptional regulator [Candidatus Hydrogenedentota bacterium]
MKKNSEKKAIAEVLGFAVRMRREIVEEWTQAELAARANVSQSAISLIERGERADIATLSKVAAAFRMPLWRLIKHAEAEHIPRMPGKAGAAV